MATPLGISYAILLTDAAQVATLQAQYPNGIQIPPATAAIVYAAPIAAAGGAYSPPCILAQLGPIYVTIPQWSTETFTYVAPDGSSTDCYWVGYFLFAGSPTSTTPTGTKIGTRRWAVGFELSDDGEGSGSFNTPSISRAASRTPDGMGLAYRSENNTGREMILPTAGTGYPTRISWERFYIRILRYPVGVPECIWYCYGGAHSVQVFQLQVNPSGYVIGRQTGLGVPRDSGQTYYPLALNVWYKLDLRVQFASASNTADAAFWLFINGKYAFNCEGYLFYSGANGLGGDFVTPAGYHIRSGLGSEFGPWAGLWADFDDWINAEEMPGANPAALITPGHDLASGSHVQLLRTTGYGASYVPTDWDTVGDWRTLNADPHRFSTGILRGTATPNAVMAVTTDLLDYPPQLGIACFTVGCYAQFAYSSTPSVGYSLDGAGAVLTSRPVFVFSEVWRTGFYTVPSNTDLPIPPPTSLDLVMVKDPGTGYVGVEILMASAEFLGYWGPEDLPAEIAWTDPAFFLQPTATTVAAPTIAYPPWAAFRAIHNAPYYDLASAVSPLSQNGDIVVMSGTYLGNGTGQDIPTGFPIHWLWIRPITPNNGADGACWWSSAQAAHTFPTGLFSPDFMVNAADRLGVPLFRPVGTHPATNKVADGAITGYQWVAVSDAAARFILNGAAATQASDFITPPATETVALDNPAFTPILTFLVKEGVGGILSPPAVKGPGHAGVIASPLVSAASADILGMGAGTFTFYPAIYSCRTSVSYSAWRKDEGTVGALSTSRLFDAISYVGDGSGDRTIAVDLGQHRPLFALVTPLTTQSWFRDPSHTALSSQSVDGTLSNTAITGGGIDFITVGPTLNANGVTYNVFVLAGCSGPGGWCANGTYFPVPWGPNPDYPSLPRPPYNPGPIPLVPIPIPSPTPLPPYTPGPGVCPPCTTLTHALDTLASRLQDTGNVHWTRLELTRYVTEALRTWNALTQTSMAQGSFPALLGIPFYDLPTQLPALRAYTVTDTYMVGDLEYALMEPPTPTAWTGTRQYLFGDLVSALEAKRDQFLMETGIVVSRVIQTLGAPVPINGRVPLHPSILTVRRLAYITASGAVYPLQRDDEWGTNAYHRPWTQTAGTPGGVGGLFPMIYSVGVTPSPPLTAQIAPFFGTPGVLDILAVTKAAVMGGLGPCLDPATGILLGVPDDWTWVVKWGALATLLSQHGVTYDPIRAQYCETRYRHGIQLAINSSVVMAARVGNVPVMLSSVSDADAFSRTWQTQTATPSAVLLSGETVIGVSPPTNAGVLVTLDVVRNMPIPALGTDCVGVEEDMLEAILCYAQHLALFKEGPDQLQQSMALLDRFFRSAGVTLAIDLVSSPNKTALKGQTQQDERELPRTIVPPIIGETSMQDPGPQ